jgi:predicted phage-related endonuclease
MMTPTGRLLVPADQLGGEAWLSARRGPGDRDPAKYRIGSSDVPSILDLPGVGTPAHVYRSKVYDIGPEPTEQMQWGHLLEAPIALEWCRRNRAVIDEIGLLERTDAPWHVSTIDRRVRECPVSRSRGVNEECLLEVKTVDSHVESRWHAEIPDRILAQILHQLYVTGYGHAHYACLVGGNRMKQGIVYADRERKLMDLVVNKTNEFRERHLLTLTEPEWNTTEKPDKMIELDKRSHPERDGVRDLDVEGVGDVMEYARASAAESAAKKEREAAGARLRQLADGAEHVTFSGELAYRLGESTRTNVDLDRLKEKYPDVYDDDEVVTHKKSHTIYIDKAYKVKGPRA